MAPEKVTPPQRQRHRADAVEGAAEPLPPTRLISDDEVEAIHNSGIDAAGGVGVRCAFAEARQVLAKAGAIIDEADGRVRLGRDIVEEALKTVPAEITLTPRNGARAVRLGHEIPDDGGGAGATNCTDLIRGRRSGNAGRIFAKYPEADAVLQHRADEWLAGGAARHRGAPPPPRGGHCHADADRQGALRVLPEPAKDRGRSHMCAIARGETLEEFGARPGVFSIINTKRPTDL